MVQPVRPPRRQPVRRTSVNPVGDPKHGEYTPDGETRPRQSGEKHRIRAKRVSVQGELQALRALYEPTTSIGGHGRCIMHSIRGKRTAAFAPLHVEPVESRLLLSVSLLDSTFGD